VGELFKNEHYQINVDLPFELTKEQLDKFYYGEYEDSTHDTSLANQTRSGASSRFHLTPTNSD